MLNMKRKLLRVVFAVLLALTMATPVFADAGGGPGSNHGCPGHQQPGRLAVDAGTNTAKAAAASDYAPLASAGGILAASYGFSLAVIPSVC